MTEVRKTIAVLPGDGIGPEVTHSAVQLLTDCAAAFNHKFTFRELPFGGAAIDRTGSPLPAETLEGCRSADAILLGAIGGPKWDSVALDKRPESGLLGLRKGLGLYINLRPIPLPRALLGISPLRPERLLDCDIEIVRELAGDIISASTKSTWKKGPLATLPHTPPRKSSASHGMHLTAPRGAIIMSPAWTKPMCSPRPISGGKRSRRSRAIITRLLSTTSPWPTPRCSSCFAPSNSTSSSPRTCLAIFSATKPPRSLVLSA